MGNRLVAFAADERCTKCLGRGIVRIYEPKLKGTFTVPCPCLKKVNGAIIIPAEDNKETTNVEEQSNPTDEAGSVGAVEHTSDEQTPPAE